MIHRLEESIAPLFVVVRMASLPVPGSEAVARCLGLPCLYGPPQFALPSGVRQIQPPVVAVDQAPQTARERFRHNRGLLPQGRLNSTAVTIAALRSHRSGPGSSTRTSPDAEVAGVHPHRYRADVIAAVAKKVVVNEQGTPVEVILSWKTFQEIAEAMGWDLDATAKGDLRKTRRDLAKGNRKAFVPLSAL